jgi:hypothetical protein
MPLRVIDTYFADQNCLVYTGRLEGQIGDKRQLFRGRVSDLPRLARNKRYNLRVRGRNDQGDRIVPLMCHARTDGAGDLFISDKFAPQIQAPPKEAEEIDIPIVMPRPTKLALFVNKELRKPK